MESMWSFQTCQCQDNRPPTESIHSTPVGCTDLGGPPPGSAVPLQGLWICWLDCSGFWVCPLQRTCLFLVTRAQTKLEWQEPDHTPVPSVWGRQAAWTQDTAPAMLCCSSRWGSRDGNLGSFAVFVKERPQLFLFVQTVSQSILPPCRKSYSAWWRPGCLPLESVGTRTPSCFSQGRVLSSRSFKYLTIACWIYTAETH